MKPVSSRNFSISAKRFLISVFCGSGREPTRSAIIHASAGETEANWRQHAPQPDLQEIFRPFDSALCLTAEERRELRARALVASSERRMGRSAGIRISAENLRSGELMQNG